VIELEGEQLIVLERGDALLLLHVLAAFERLLRLGGFSIEQLASLLPEGAGAADALGDVEMAELAVEAGEPLRRQLA
jgi:hypothetical protein